MFSFPFRFEFNLLPTLFGFLHPCLVLSTSYWTICHSSRGRCFEWFTVPKACPNDRVLRRLGIVVC